MKWSRNSRSGMYMNDTTLHVIRPTHRTNRWVLFETQFSSVGVIYDTLSRAKKAVEQEHEHEQGQGARP